MAINHAAMDYSYLDEGVEKTDPKQLRIMKKLSNHLARTPGYDQIEVSRGKGTVSAREAEDTLSIFEAPQAQYGDPVGRDALSRRETWTLLIQGWPKDDPAHPSDPAYKLAAAVNRQLAMIVEEQGRDGKRREDNLFNLGGDLAEMSIGQTIVRPVSNEHGNSRLAEFFIPLLLTIQTDKLNPSH